MFDEILNAPLIIFAVCQYFRLPGSCYLAKLPWSSDKDEYYWSQSFQVIVNTWEREAYQLAEGEGFDTSTVGLAAGGTPNSNMNGNIM